MPDKLQPTGPDDAKAKDDKKPRALKEKLTGWGVKADKLTKEGKSLARDVLDELRQTARGAVK